MQEQALKTVVNRFIKTVSYNAQREIEKVVRNALANGRLKTARRPPPR
jgi:carotenoid cleavage dioxygenase-like enzyme